MSSGYHFLYLPILFSIVIPGILLYVALEIHSDFYFISLIIFSGILIFITIFDLWQVFIMRKGNTMKLHNALIGKELIKLLATFSTIAIVVSITSPIIIPEYNNIAPDDKKIIVDSKTYGNALFFSLYFFLFSITPLLPVVMKSDYFRGKSFAYFQVGVDEEKPMKKISNYQDGLESYDKFLNEKFGTKLKHIDEIESYLLSEKSQEVENKIKDLLNTFNDELEPARKLNSWINITIENIFKNIQPYEHIEKLLRYISPVIAAITAVAIYFNSI